MGKKRGGGERKSEINRRNTGQRERDIWKGGVREMGGGGDGGRRGRKREARTEKKREGRGQLGRYTPDNTEFEESVMRSV